MEGSKYFVFDSFVFGAKTIFTQMRLYFFATLTILAIGLAFVGIGLALNYIALREILKFIISSPEYDQIIPFFKGWFFKYKIEMVIGSLITFIYWIWFILAAIRLALDVHDTGSSSVKRMFSISHLLLKGGIIFIIFFSLFILGFIFFVIPGVIVVIRLQFAGIFLVDKNASIGSSFKQSWALTRGYSWPLFGWSVTLFALNFISPLGWLAMGISQLSCIYIYRILSLPSNIKKHIDLKA